MQMRQLGGLWPVSALTLGGGGLGQLWGDTSREEAVATARAAVDRGITLLDMAPAYGDGEAEAVIGEAFAGRLPDGVRVTTKVRYHPATPETIAERMRTSLEESLRLLRLERVDLYFLHSNIVPDGGRLERLGDQVARTPVDWTTYAERVRPAFERLAADGLIGAWGITGIGRPDAVIDALADAPRPAAVQVIANPLDSPGELQLFDGPTRAREIMAAAKAEGVGVLGIRAVQGGALTDEIDRPLPEDHAVVADYVRAAPIRAIAHELGVSTAFLMHRYALTMDGVDSVILGVKNRAELDEACDAAAAGPLEPELMARIDQAAGRA